MQTPTTTELRRTTSSHLSTLALAGIIATLSLTVVAIWTTHERAENANINGTENSATELSRQTGS